MASVYRQLHVKASSKNMANTRKEEFEDKLHLSEITFIIYVPKEEQV